MHIPNTYHKLVRQRHHELHPKVFYYDDQIIPNETMALHQLFWKLHLNRAQDLDENRSKMPSIYREIPSSEK